MTETATPAVPKVEVVPSYSLPNFINKFITYSCSLNQLLEIFCNNWLPEIRQACIDRLDFIFRGDEYFYYDRQVLDKLEEIIRQLFDLSITSKFGEQLLGMYVFCCNKEISKKAILFAISLLYRNSTDSLLMHTVSKAVCSRLSKYCPDECYDGWEIKTSIYRVLPELKRMLQLLFEKAIMFRYLQPTREQPWECNDFCLIERALKLIVHYREHDQSFLPQIEELIRLHKEGLLIFDSRLTFEPAKNIAVLKEAAKLLRMAQKQTQKK